MTTRSLFSCVLLTGIFVLCSMARATDWPHWRGPTRNGISPDGKPPTEWNETKNLRWKVAIPGSGSGSPIVWKGRVYVVSAIADTAGEAGARRSVGPQERQERRGGRRGQGRGGRGGRAPALVPQELLVSCLDLKTGKTIWTEKPNKLEPHEGHHRDHGFASSSPCTDGKMLFAHFGSRGLYAYDLDGELIWKRTDLGSMTTRGTFGEGSSLALHGDRLILPWDHEGPSYIAALNKKNGKTVWKVKREEPSSWATPIVVETAKGTQVIASGQNYVRGYDIDSGKELWRCDGQTGRPVASPVAGNGLVFVGSGFRGAYLGALRLNKNGDLRKSDGVAWEIAKYTPDVPSPLLSGTRLYFHSGRSGILSCHDAESGKPLYSASRVSGLGNVYASPVAANGHVYLTGRDGTTVVIKDGDELEVVATNTVGEPVDATPAISGDAILLRGRSHLFCYGR